MAWHPLEQGWYQRWGDWKEVKEAIRVKQIESQTRRFQTDCQTHLFAVITARQQGSSFPCCVSTKAGVQGSRKGFFFFFNYTKLFFYPLKESNHFRPNPSSQLKGTERVLSFLFSSQNHWFLAPLKVWKTAIPFKSTRMVEKWILLGRGGNRANIWVPSPWWQTQFFTLESCSDEKIQVWSPPAMKQSLSNTGPLLSREDQPPLSMEHVPQEVHGEMRETDAHLPAYL